MGQTALSLDIVKRLKNWENEKSQIIFSVRKFNVSEY